MKKILSYLLVVWTILALPVSATQAPDFTLKSRDGKNMRLSELRGQVVLLNFWASWCGPCREEMPILNAIYHKYKDLGFTVLGVNLDAKSEKAIAYLKDTPVEFPVLYDPDGKVSKIYGVSAMPSTVVIDRNGKVRYLHQGYKTGYEDIYREQIKTLMRE